MSYTEFIDRWLRAAAATSKDCLMRNGCVVCYDFAIVIDSGGAIESQPLEEAG